MYRVSKSTCIVYPECPERSNSISDIVLEPIRNLQKLNLGDNKLIEISNWCDVEFNSYFPNLLSLNLDNNFISELSQIRCHEDFQYHAFVVYCDEDRHWVHNDFVRRLAFTKNEWCQWEVDINQERGRRQGRDAVLMIMLKTITSKHMTSPLCTLLDSTSHLQYKRGVGEDSFWKAVTEGIRKPIGHSPISELKYFSNIQ